VASNIFVVRTIQHSAILPLPEEVYFSLFRQGTSWKCGGTVSRKPFQTTKKLLILPQASNIFVVRTIRHSVILPLPEEVYFSLFSHGTSGECGGKPFQTTKKYCFFPPQVVFSSFGK